MSGPSPIKMEGVDSLEPMSTPPAPESSMGEVTSTGINPTASSTTAAGTGVNKILMLQKRNFYFKQHGLDASNTTLINKYVDYLKTHENQEPPVSLFQTTAIMPPSSSMPVPSPSSSGAPMSSGSSGGPSSGSNSGASSSSVGGSLEKQMSSLISIVKAAHQLDLTNRKADVFQTMQSILASQPQQPPMLQGLMCPQRLPSSSQHSNQPSSSQPHPSNNPPFTNQPHSMQPGRPGGGMSGPGGLNDRPGQNGPHDATTASAAPQAMGTPPQPKNAGRKKNEPASNPRNTKAGGVKDSNSPTLASLAGGVVPTMPSPLTPANAAGSSASATAMGSMANNAAIINAANAAAATAAAAASANAAAAAAANRGLSGAGRGTTTSSVGGMSQKELLKYAANESESRQQQLLQLWQQRKLSQTDAHQFYFQTPELVKKLATITTAHGLNLPRDNEGLALVELFTLGLENHLKNLVQSIRHASRRRMDFCKEWGSNGVSLMQITNEPKKEHQEAQKKWEEKQQRWNKFQEGKSGSTGTSTTGAGAGATSLLPSTTTTAPADPIPSSSFLPSSGGLPPSTSSFLPSSSSSFLPSSDLLPASTSSFLPGSSGGAGGGLPTSSLFDGVGGLGGSFSASPQPISSLTMTVPDAVSVLVEHPHYRKSARLMKTISGLKRKDPPVPGAGGSHPAKKEKATTENKDNKDAAAAPPLVSASPLSHLPPSPAVLSSLTAATGLPPSTIGGLTAAAPTAAFFLPPSTSAAVESLGHAMQQ